MNDVAKICDELPPVDDGMEQTFEYMSNLRRKQIAVPRNTSFSRKEIVQAFEDAFELIGGVTRLSIWAHEHPTEFYRLYSKLLPSQSQTLVDHSGRLEIIHKVAPGPLDGAPVEDAEFTEVANAVPD